LTQSKKLAAVILAGGRSSRMGRDKARLKLAGRTFLSRVREQAQALGCPVVVVRRDLVPRCGPLGGVLTAFRQSRAEVLVFLSCDAVFVSARLLRRLLRCLPAKRHAAFVHSGGRVGFPFVLRRSSLPLIERQLARGDFSLQSLARRLHAARLRLPPAQAHELFNINTPADLREARRRWRACRPPGGERQRTN
jgi:molybdopterin-guanine dinucleotide biosynthesis protein A